MINEMFSLTKPITSSANGSDGGAEHPRFALSLEKVLESLGDEGWRGFSLFRRFLRMYPGERRRLARALRAVSWNLRTDIDARRVRFTFLGSFSTDNLTEAL